MQLPPLDQVRPLDVALHRVAPLPRHRLQPVLLHVAPDDADPLAARPRARLEDPQLLRLLGHPLHQRRVLDGQVERLWDVGVVLREPVAHQVVVHDEGVLVAGEQPRAEAVVVRLPRARQVETLRRKVEELPLAAPQHVPVV